MPQFSRMAQNGNTWQISSKKTFCPFPAPLDNTFVKQTLDFAFAMTFGNKGEHRDHRSGGGLHRKKGEIFANTFQGKLAEFALYVLLRKHFPGIPAPDLSAYGLGAWDDSDFSINSKLISVKSTKSFGNLLLLETADWDTDGNYIPNLEKGHASYDFSVLLRMNPFCEEILRKNRLFYSNDIAKPVLESLLLNNVSWQYDVPGFVTREQLQEIIRERYVIPRGAFLNGKTRMDAENYYIQAGDMTPFEQIVDLIRR